MAKPGRPPRVPTCGHPDREHYDKGMCRSCAGADDARAPTCGHPGRKHFSKDMCHACYMTIWNREHPDANSGTGWRKRHPEEHRAFARKANLKKQYGMTVEGFETIWTEQGGKCANPGCSTTTAVAMPDHRYGLQVDHDHATGLFRALLCGPCNLALGCVGDDPERLLGLVEYLRRH